MKFSKIALMAVVTAVSGTVLAGCSSETADTKSEDAAYGNVKMKLTLGTDVPTDVTSLTWSIALASAPNVEVAGATVPVGAVGAAATATWALQAGDYIVTLTAADAPTCLGSQAFTVTANSTEAVDVVLTCGTAVGTPGDTGSAEVSVSDVVDITGKACGITSVFAAPTITSEDVILKSTYETSTATLAWTVEPSDAGHFDDASIADPVFNCDSVTGADIKLTITDNTTDVVCTDAVTIHVSCVDGPGITPPVCDNGLLEFQEDCTTCPEDVIASTGDPRACEAVVCGDGFVDAGEDCDTCFADVEANGGVCVRCGNGVVDGTDDCTTCPADVVAESGDPEACTVAGPGDACVDCVTGLDDAIDDYYLSTCANDPACEATLRCVADSGCWGAADPNHWCYCGQGVSYETCVDPNYTPVGVCASQVRAGFSSALYPNNQDLVDNALEPTTSAGNAYVIMSALKPGECAIECKL